jgi:hypothetical protein
MADETTALQEQMGGFESSVTKQLDRVEGKIDAIARAVGGVPAPQKTVEPLPLFRAFEEVASAPLPPAAAPAAAPESKGILSGIAHAVEGLEHKAVDAVRSLAGPKDDDDACPDNGVLVAEAAPAAGSLPLGPHAQAVEERRAHTAPALAMAG